MNQSKCNQSPIRIVPTIFSRLPLSLDLRWQPADGVPVWGAHGLEVRFKPNPLNGIALDDVDFILEHFHFHRPSEHYRADVQFDAELHIVHKTGDGRKAAVIAVFLTVSDQADDAVDLSFFEALAERTGDNASVPLNPRGWLPPRTASAIRYEGSLTTGDHEEIVSWVVLGELRITSAQYRLIFGETKPHARELQDLNRRYVVEFPWAPNAP
ncbi:carbonic anhydrase family protein [Methylogaea oryzae]|nr:carbonic anhydrase family protein [Methylogaea oryzae]